jgi:hypothetical protein
VRLRFSAGNHDDERPDRFPVIAVPVTIARLANQLELCHVKRMHTHIGVDNPGNASVGFLFHII